MRRDVERHTLDMNENERTVRQAVDAFVAGDMDTLRTLFADDVVVHVPPGLPMSGDHQGFDAFMSDMLGTLVGALGGPPQLEVHDFTSSDDHVVGLYRVRAERDGTAYEWPHVNVYHVANGRITEFWWNPFDLETVQRALGA